MSATPVMPAPQAASATTTTRAWGPQPFRNDIVGLRAVAILLVVAFHAAIPYFRGGFVGVDVFLVLSGYLITSMLLGDVARHGRMRFGRFYARRAKRVLPPAAAVLAVIALAQASIAGPLKTYNALFDYLFALIGASNWWFASHDSGYLDGGLIDSPVLHYWSLSVEQQAYLLWPLLLVPAAVVLHRTPHRGIWIIRTILSVILGASLAAALWTTSHDPDAAYFVTHTRLWQFAAGGLVATFLRVDKERSVHVGAQLTRAIVSWAGLGAIIWSALRITEETPYPGWVAIIPTLGTAALLWSGGARCVPGSVGWVLSNVMFRGIGLISYSWYLWHWPALVFLDELMVDPAMQWRMLAVALSLLLAVLSYHALEKPLATIAGLRNSWAAGGLAVGSVLASTVVVLSMGLISINTMTGTPVQQPASTLASIADRPRDENLIAPDPDITLPPRTMFSGPVTPQVNEARGDYPDKRECMLDDTAQRPDDCVLGPADGTTVVVVGDSHMHQWQGALQEIAEDAKWRLHVFYLGGCPLAEIPASWATKELDRFARPSCATFRDETIEQITELQPEIIFTSALSRYTTDSDAMRQAWQASLDRLSGVSAQWVYLYDTPWPGMNVPSCISKHFDDWEACRFTPDPGAEPLPQMIADGDLGDALAVNLNDQICPDDTCPVVYEGYLMYRDESHLTNSFAKRLTPILKQRLERGEVIDKPERELPQGVLTPGATLSPTSSAPGSSSQTETPAATNPVTLQPSATATDAPDQPAGAETPQG